MSMWSWWARKRGAVLLPFAEEAQAPAAGARSPGSEAQALAAEAHAVRLEAVLSDAIAGLGKELAAAGPGQFEQRFEAEMEALRKELRQEGRQRLKQANAAESAIELLRQSVEQRAEAARQAKDLERSVEERLRKDWLRDLLGALDGLDSGIRRLRVDAAALPGAEQYAAGFEMARGRLLGVLRRHGVEPIEEGLGSAFDPACQRAVGAREDGAAPPGTVLELYLRGYRRDGEVLRSAEVVVARAPGGIP